MSGWNWFDGFGQVATETHDTAKKRDAKKRKPKNILSLKPKNSIGGGRGLISGYGSGSDEDDDEDKPYGSSGSENEDDSDGGSGTKMLPMSKKLPNKRKKPF